MRIARTHVVDIYPPREGQSQRNPYGAPVARFAAAPVAVGVEVNIQPLTGSVEALAAGREVRASYKIFAPPGTPLREDYGIKVTSVLVPNSAPVGSAYVARFVGEHGGKWDTEVLADRTPESVG